MYQDILIEKINSYKSYPDTVKTEAIRQVKKLDIADKAMLKKLYSILPSHLKRLDKWVKRFNKIEKKVLCLEKHNFAPEMNKLHFLDGSFIKVPQQTTVKKAVEFILYNNLE